SRWKVTLVPAFQPGITLIVNTLSSFLYVFPSGLGTLRVIFIFFTHPFSTSSSVRWRSCSIGGSCFRLLRSFTGEPWVKDCDRKALLREEPPNPKKGSSISSKPLKNGKPPEPRNGGLTLIIQP